MRYIILGCGKTKERELLPAKDLYTGSLFTAARKYAEASPHPWGIISAAHGLVLPDTVIVPYNLQMGASNAAIEPVAKKVQDQINTLGWSGVFELHMGIRYLAVFWWLRRNRLIPSITLEQPLEDLEVGARLHWYTEQWRIRESRG